MQVISWLMVTQSNLSLWCWCGYQVSRLLVIIRRRAGIRATCRIWLLWKKNLQIDNPYLLVVESSSKSSEVRFFKIFVRSLQHLFPPSWLYLPGRGDSDSSDASHGSWRCGRWDAPRCTRRVYYLEKGEWNILDLGPKLLENPLVLDFLLLS